MNEKIVVNGYYFNAEGQILLSCATDSVNSICVKESRWDKKKWSPLPWGPTFARCPPHPCSAKPLQFCTWFTWPKNKGDWPIELLTEPINGKRKALIDVIDLGDGLAEKVGRVVCACDLDNSFWRNSGVYSPCSWYFDHSLLYLFQINKHIRWVMQITVCALSYLIYHSPTNIR